MKMSNFQFKIALLLAAAMFISCSQKEVADEPDVREVPTADVGAEQQVNPVIKKITVKNSEDTQEPEEPPSESVEVNSTANNPETQEIKNILKKVPCTITFIDYPLLPEYDCMDVFSMVKDSYLDSCSAEDREIILMGDSAGGGLALALAQNINMENIYPKPSKIILLSPA